MPQPIPAFAAHRIAELTARVRAELDMLSFATKPWVIPKYHAGRKIFDVVIVGAGQSGLVAGHALKRRGVTNLLILEMPGAMRACGKPPPETTRYAPRKRSPAPISACRR